MQRVTPTMARGILLAIWMCGFLVCMSVLAYLRLRNWIEKDTFKSALQTLNASYATYLGTMLVFHLASPRRRAGARTQAGVPFVISLIGSLLWNGLICAFMLPLLWGGATIESTRDDVEIMNSILSWFVAPTIGFFFARHAPSPA